MQVVSKPHRIVSDPPQIWTLQVLLLEPACLVSTAYIPWLQVLLCYLETETISVSGQAFFPPYAGDNHYTSSKMKLITMSNISYLPEHMMSILP